MLSSSFSFFSQWFCPMLFPSVLDHFSPPNFSHPHLPWFCFSYSQYVPLGSHLSGCFPLLFLPSWNLSKKRVCQLMQLFSHQKVIRGAIKKPSTLTCQLLLLLNHSGQEQDSTFNGHLPHYFSPEFSGPYPTSPFWEGPALGHRTSGTWVLQDESMEGGCMSPLLLLPTCAAEKNVRILAALFMQLRFPWEGVVDVLS